MGLWRHLPCRPSWSEQEIPINPLITGDIGGLLCQVCYVAFLDEATSAKNPQLNTEARRCQSSHAPSRCLMGQTEGSKSMLTVLVFMQCYLYVIPLVSKWNLPGCWAYLIMSSLAFWSYGHVSLINATTTAEGSRYHPRMIQFERPFASGVSQRLGESGEETLKPLGELL